jgi:hypothetical protein
MRLGSLSVFGWVAKRVSLCFADESRRLVGVVVTDADAGADRRRRRPAGQHERQPDLDRGNALTAAASEIRDRGDFSSLGSSPEREWLV